MRWLPWWLWSPKNDYQGLVKPVEPPPRCVGTPCVEWVLESRNSLSAVPPGMYRVRICEDDTFSVEPL